MALDLTLRRGGVLLHPPGASPYVALIVAIAGFEVGLNTPYTVAETLAVRSFLTDGLGAFLAALRGIPDPSSGAIASASLLALVCLFSLGGWINVALALVRGEEPTSETWRAGIMQSGRAIFWLGLFGSLVLLGVGGVGALSAWTLRASFIGTLGDGWSSSGLPMATVAAFALSLCVGGYALASTSLMGVVAVAEPQTRFLAIPARSREVFAASNSGRFCSRMALVLAGWFAVKLALYQLIIPFKPLPGNLSDVLSVAGSVLNGMLTFGDGMVALVAIVLAVQIYQGAVTSGS